MICIKSKHFSLNRILSLFLGLWPYQQSRLTRLQTILVFSILMSAIFFQLTTFITTEFSFNFAIKILSPVFCWIIFLIKFSSFWINTQTVKYSLDQLQCICNELKDENEIAIIERYGYYTRCYTIKMILLVLSGSFIVLAQQFLPRVFKTFLFINKSYSRPKLFITMEYFVDQEKYYYLILLHIGVSACTGAFAMIAIGTTLVGSLKHACGLFMITSYRIKQAISITMSVNIELEDKIIMYEKIICAVDIHRKAMQLIQRINTEFEGTFSFLIVCGVCALSFNVYHVFQLTLREGNMETLSFHLVCVGLILLYIFLANYVGQEVIDHNDYVFFTVYNVRWYMAPLQVQKLILFLLQRSSKPFRLNIGKLFAASLEGFATLINASMSYFTVMYSTQE